MKDPELSLCSAGARGVWMDVLCLMFESPKRGFLITNGRPWTLEQISIAIRGDWQENLVYLKELVHNGVMTKFHARKRDRDFRAKGAYFSRRIVKDDAKRTQWRMQKQSQRIHNKGSLSTGVSTPSSSSSSSSSSNPSSNSTFSQDSSMAVEQTKGKKNGWIDRNEQRDREEDRALENSFKDVAEKIRPDVPKRAAAKRAAN